MENIFGNIINLFFILLGAIVFFGIIVKIMVNVFSKEKSIKAIIVDKQIYEKTIYRKNDASYVVKKYIITFNCEDKKRYFEVSELSYNNYRMNRQGILIYKRNRIIDFR